MAKAKEASKVKQSEASALAALRILSDATDEYMRTPIDPIITWKVIETRFRIARNKAHKVLREFPAPALY